MRNELEEMVCLNLGLSFLRWEIHLKKGLILVSDNDKIVIFIDSRGHLWMYRSVLLK
jgi:hypothetical protein